MGFQERRRAPRFQLYQVIEISAGQEEFLPADLSDISELGMKIITEKALEPQERLFILFTAGEGSGCREITCEAAVVHCIKSGNKWAIGVEFSEMKKSDREYLDQYLKTFVN